MNIIVCIKQTPDTEHVKFNPETGTVIREGVPNIMNPDDRQALEVALTLKDQEGGKVTCLSMGLPAATEILKEALAMGADEGILLTDRLLAGSDTLATSTALAAAIKKIGDYDIILCGKTAVDGETAQVGPEIAEHLGLPQITGAISTEYKDGKFIVKRVNEETAFTLACPAPLLVTVEKAGREPRFASIKGKMKARKAVIPQWSVADIGVDEALVGLPGSPTKVRKAFAPQPPVVSGEIINVEDLDEAVALLMEKLISADVLNR